MNPKFEEQFRQEGFTEPTLIQKYVYPKLAEGKNVVGLAPTGSGKTLAYSLPLLKNITQRWKSIINHGSFSRIGCTVNKYDKTMG